MGDVGEGVCGVDRKRGENGKDSVPELATEKGPVALIEVGGRHHRDADRSQRRGDLLLEDAGGLGQEGLDPTVDGA